MPIRATPLAKLDIVQYSFQLSVENPAEGGKLIGRPANSHSSVRTWGSAMNGLSRLLLKLRQFCCFGFGSPSRRQPSAR
jgi:hypothetical protein